MNESINKKLFDIFREYVGHVEPNKNSQLCIIWPLNDPPDVLEYTPQIGAIKEIFNIDIDENNAVKMFDMSLEEASQHIESLILSQH